jgi:hypothetical protein
LARGGVVGCGFPVNWLFLFSGGGGGGREGRAGGGPLEGVGTENHIKLQNTEYTCSKTHVHKITIVPVFLYGANYYAPRHINNRYINNYTL